MINYRNFEVINIERLDIDDYDPYEMKLDSVKTSFNIQVRDMTTNEDFLVKRDSDKEFSVAHSDEGFYDSADIQDRYFEMFYEHDVLKSYDHNVACLVEHLNLKELTI